MTLGDLAPSRLRASIIARGLGLPGHLPTLFGQWQWSIGSAQEETVVWPPFAPEGPRIWDEREDVRCGFKLAPFTTECVLTSELFDTRG